MNIIEGKSYDVIVAGAGCAGFCAAVQAARSGVRTALFEHFAMPGGSLTVLGSNSIDQFNNPHRPIGERMVIGGIAWEYVRELSRRGFACIPDMDAPYRVHWQYGVKVNGVAAAQCMDDLLLDAGVDLYYRQGVVSAETDGGCVSAVLVTTRAGLVRHRARFFVDCTGDGDLCAWAGADWMQSPDLQPGSLRLYPNADAREASAYEKARRLWQGYTAEEPSLSRALLSGSPYEMIQAKGDNVNHIAGFNSADSDSRTAAEIRARRAQVKLMRALQEGNAPAELLATAPECAPRESRRIMGDVVMTEEDYLNQRRYDDAVCYTYWFIDQHREEGASRIIYLKDEKTPTISLGALRPAKLKNVFVAGRCASSDRACNSAIRVKASCMAMGQAAGAAAALAAVQNAADSRSVSADELRRYLSAQGAIVP